MTLWKKLVCMVVGHKSSMYRGGVPGIRLSFPRDPTPKEIVTAAGAQSGGLGNPGLFSNIAVAVTCDTYDLDVCKRCFEVHARPPPPKCVHCGQEEFYHTNKECATDCLNCRQSFGAHIDGKCPFDASGWKATTFSPIAL